MNARTSRTSLFSIIEQVHGTNEWGSVLDAGSGVKSATWISGLKTKGWTAVSADAEHLEDIRSNVGPAMRKQDQLLLGNWADWSLLENARFDHVIADYLIGAMEGYAPYRQEALMRRLKPLVGKRIYVTGVDPYVLGKADTPAGHLVQALGRLRDATAMLAGVQIFREYPAEWVIDRLEQAGLRLVYADRFPCVYDAEWLEGLIADCHELCRRIEDRDIAVSLAARADLLAQEGRTMCTNLGGLKWGTEYVMAAEPA